MPRCAIFAALATTVLGVANPDAAAAQTAAHPDPTPNERSQDHVTVEWSAPPGCPQTREVQAEIESLISAGARIAERPTVVARATASEVHGRWSMLMHIQTARAEEVKAIEGESCARLADAFAVIVAFLVDPTVQRQSLTDAATEPPTTVSAPTDPTPIAILPPSPQLELTMAPVAVVGAGLLPFPALGFGARASLARSSHVRWELAGLYWLDRETTAPLASGGWVGARVGLATVQPSVCVTFSAGVWAACVGADFGEMRAQGPQTPYADFEYGGGRSLWVAAMAAVSARIRIAKFLSLQFRVDGGLPFFRPNFFVDNAPAEAPVRAFRPEVVFGMVTVCPEIRLFSTDSSVIGHSAR